MIGAIIIALLVGIFIGRAYHDFEYPKNPPSFEGQRKMAIKAILNSSSSRDREAYRRDLDKMNVDYVTLRDSFCTEFQPPSGKYWHTIIVCFDKESRKADVYRH